MPNKPDDASELEEWLGDGVAEGATHVLILYDDDDFNHFPDYVRPGESVREVATQYDGTNVRVVVVYDLRRPLGPQLDERDLIRS